jgi:ComF family protein
MPLQSEAVCGHCLQHPPPYDRCVAPFLYAHPIDALVKAAKFRQNLHHAAQLGKLLATELQQRVDERPDCLIPVPLHRWRLFRRGYNQALELAREVSRKLAVPIDWRCCARIRHTPPQTGLDAKERRRNLQGAFSVREGVSYRHVAIVDDVITTGQTAAELAVALQGAGVERVDVWAAARATP